MRRTSVLCDCCGRMLRDDETAGGDMNGYLHIELHPQHFLNKIAVCSVPPSGDTFDLCVGCASAMVDAVPQLAHRNKAWRKREAEKGEVRRKALWVQGGGKLEDMPDDWMRGE